MSVITRVTHLTIHAGGKADKLLERLNADDADLARDAVGNPRYCLFEAVGDVRFTRTLTGKVNYCLYGRLREVIRDAQKVDDWSFYDPLIIIMEHEYSDGPLAFEVWHLNAGGQWIDMTRAQLPQEEV